MWVGEQVNKGVGIGAYRKSTASLVLGWFRCSVADCIRGHIMFKTSWRLSWKTKAIARTNSRIDCPIRYRLSFLLWLSWDVFSSTDFH